MTTSDGFPLDWNEWQTEWRAWKASHKADLRPTSWRFPGKNFLADEILGTWSINGRNVELSEVTFPDLGGTGRGRYVGITFGTGAGTDTPDNPLVGTFTELEHELGLDRAEAV